MAPSSLLQWIQSLITRRRDRENQDLVRVRVRMRRGIKTTATKTVKISIRTTQKAFFFFFIHHFSHSVAAKSESPCFCLRYWEVFDQGKEIMEPKNCS